MQLRLATVADIAAIITIEQQAFSGDQIHRRQFKRFITQQRAYFPLMVDDQQQVLGYALMLQHKGTQLARIYSLAVAPQARGQGVAKALLQACELHALTQGFATVRLEVRLDNVAAQRLYQQLGYHPLKLLMCYYDDDAAGMRMQKRLQPQRPQALVPAPYYTQTTDFTCGPACLLMAMRALDKQAPFSRQAELRIWREATTIFMTSGHGGSSAQGLALAAASRGFVPHLYLSSNDTPFLDGVRSAEKREVMQLVNQDFSQQLEERGLLPAPRELTLAQMQSYCDRGRAVLCLISSYRLTGDKAPHWVLVVGVDQQFVWFHDPDADEQHQLTSHAYIPVAHREFRQMSSYGRQRYSAALVIDLD